MDFPNPFHGLVEVACPQCGVIAQVLKLLLVVALVWVTGQYFTKNKTVLAAEALAALYLLFA
jgi:hypothetical protein